MWVFILGYHFKLWDIDFNYVYLQGNDAEEEGVTFDSQVVEDGSQSVHYYDDDMDVEGENSTLQGMDPFSL
jgi:hypothetical protein